MKNILKICFMIGCTFLLIQCSDNNASPVVSGPDGGPDVDVNDVEQDSAGGQIVEALVASTNPADQSVDVDITTGVQIIFTHSVQDVQFTVYRKLASDVLDIVAGTASYDDAILTATFDGEADFKAGSNYVIKVEYKTKGTSDVKNHVFGFKTHAEPFVSDLGNPVDPEPLAPSNDDGSSPSGPGVVGTVPGIVSQAACVGIKCRIIQVKDFLDKDRFENLGLIPRPPRNPNDPVVRNPALPENPVMPRPRGCDDPRAYCLPDAISLKPFERTQAADLDRAPVERVALPARDLPIELPREISENFNR